MALLVIFRVSRRLWRTTIQKGFNAREDIGDFIKPIKPMLYKLQTYLKHKRR